MTQTVRLRFFVELRYEVAEYPADFIFNVHAARTASQTIVAEELRVTPALALSHFVDPAHGNRYVRLRAPPGPVTLRYDATVDIAHHIESPDSIPEVPVAQLPAEALAYIYPSRYCESDRLRQFAFAEFGAMRPGYWRVRAIQDWVQRQTRFVSRSSTATTSAVDTLVGRVGVCRDFAHVMIALCRAINIPARFATGIDYGADPAFGPTDFHAYVEAFLGGRWYLFDPSGMALPMGLLRLGVGRDAADVSFATIFGTVRSEPPLIGIEGVEDLALGITLPRACVDGLSTDGERPAVSATY
ncbi:MAG TPA: transglutaminase family protein [Usitatibacter sp.]|nr:transglutaminase family protein [Usitatibacter sp.]